MDLEQLIKNSLAQASEIVVSTIKKEHPKLLAELAGEIFTSKGQSHGRHWNQNKASTTRRKGFDHRNVESGQLFDTLTTPGFLEQEDYMQKLPRPRRGSSYGYLAANELNNHENRFDDIGHTQEDEIWIEDQLGIKIQAALTELSNEH